MDRGIMALGGIINAGDSALASGLGAVAADAATAPSGLLTFGGTTLDEAAASLATAHAGAAHVGTVDVRAGVDALVAPISKDFFHRPAADVPGADWSSLAAALAADADATILTGPRTLFDAPDLRQVVDKIQLGHRESIPVADRYFAAWRAVESGPDAIRAQSQTLLKRNPHEFAADDWKALGALVDADPTGTLTKVPAMERREFNGMRQSIVDLAKGARSEVGEQVDIHFHRWVRDHDPEYPARWDAAVDASIKGPWTRDHYWTLRLESERFDELGSRLSSGLTQAQRHHVVYHVANRDVYALAGWIQRHDPAYPAMLDDALAAKVADENAITSLQSALVSTVRDDIVEFTAGRPFEERNRIINAVLRGPALNDWNRAHDPTFPQQIEDAIDLVMTGGYQWKATSLLDAEGDRLPAILARRSYEDQLRYFTARLGDNSEKHLAWLKEHAPDWDVQVATAIDEALAGTPSERSKAILPTLADRFEELATGRTYAEQDTLAKALLHRSEYYEWNLGNNPANRAKVDAAVQRVIEGEPEAEGDGIIFIQEKDRIDQLTAGHPFEMQQRIAKAVLGEGSLWYTEWAQRADPNRVANLNAAADAVIAGTIDRGASGTLFWLREDLPDVVFGGRSVIDNLKIIARVNSNGTASQWVAGWRAALEPELSRLQRQAAAEAAVGELSDDARLLFRGEHAKLDDLTAGANYETRLRIADAVLDSRSLQEWKVVNDANRVASVVKSANAIADGAFTPHDMRVLRGELDVLGIVRDRPYAERLPVAEIALDGGSIEYWKRANDPEYHARIIAAIDEVETGTLSPEAAELLASDRTNVFRHLAERSPQTQGAVAVAMLGRETSSFEGIQAAMRDLALDASTRLKALPEHEMTAGIRASTTELLDRNIKRMSGFNVDDPNRGYAQHPDYAEMGRVQSNLELLEAVAKGRTSATSAQEVLTW